MNTNHVVVVGAGIGGTAVAGLLAQSGRTVTVLERSSVLGEVGAGLSIWPAAMAVLDRLGVRGRLDGELKADGGLAGLRNPDGRWLASVESSRAGTPAMIHRARLHEAIVAGLPSSVEIRTGAEVVDVDQDDAGATVTTADGHRIRAGLVVGADGIRSVIRRTVSAWPRQPQYAGYTALRGVADIRADAASETWGRGRRFGVAPLIDNRTYWFAAVTADEGTFPRMPAAEVYAALDTMFAGWHRPIADLLGATDPDDVLVNDVYDLPLPLPPFTAGRTALLGDAAHATTPNLGQGACAAIEDADALARSLDDHADLATALAAYEAKRRQPATRLVRRSRMLGRIAQAESAPAVALRDGALSIVGRVASLLGAGGGRGHRQSEQARLRRDSR
jgi:2-polyprenyl-6-methoxyphenol hydroxylase-like FAD-dependent oxidoreductase